MRVGHGRPAGAHWILQQLHAELRERLQAAAGWLGACSKHGKHPVASRCLWLPLLRLRCSPATVVLVSNAVQNSEFLPPQQQEQLVAALLKSSSGAAAAAAAAAAAQRQQQEQQRLQQQTKQQQAGGQQ